MSIVKINDVLKVEDGVFKVASSETSPSDNTPTYALYRSPSITDEGTVVTYTLNTNNVAEGTLVAYTVTGISQADLSSGSLTGNFTVNAIGVATVSFTIANDELTEGTETMSLSAAGQSLDVTINDTSLDPSPYSYYLASRDFIGVKPDGTWDIEELQTGPNLILGTSDFTIQYWIYTASVILGRLTNVLAQYRNAGEQSATIEHKTANFSTITQVSFRLNPTTIMLATDNIYNAWKHIAVVRQNGTTKLYVNGLVKNTRADTTNYNSPNNFFLAGLPTSHTIYNNSYTAFVGSIKNFSISQGSALYTANFTPPPRVYFLCI